MHYKASEKRQIFNLEIIDRKTKLKIENRSLSYYNT
jgi:hypothetical protein